MELSNKTEKNENRNNGEKTNRKMDKNNANVQYMTYDTLLMMLFQMPSYLLLIERLRRKKKEIS